MSTTNPAVFSPGGLSYPAASELASQIDGTPNADKLSAVGFPGPVAVELARQMSAGTGSVSDMLAIGIGPMLATAIKTAIDA
jgi:hypothetical protein